MTLARGEERLISCEELAVGHDGRALLPPLDLAIRRGRLVVVVGRNGSGKTTWFRTLLGLIPPVSGRVVHHHPDLDIAYVPQSAPLERHLPVSAFDVVLWGTLRGRDFLRPFARPGDRARAARALEEAEAADLGDRLFHDLSKGQRQRVLFARMLASEPDLALLDEPTAAMDIVAERRAIERMAALCHDRGITLILVTHGLDVAREHADDILLFDRSTHEVVFGTREHVLQHEAYHRVYGPTDA